MTIGCAELGHGRGQIVAHCPLGQGCPHGDVAVLVALLVTPTALVGYFFGLLVIWTAWSMGWMLRVLRELQRAHEVQTQLGVALIRGDAAPMTQETRYQMKKRVASWIQRATVPAIRVRATTTHYATNLRGTGAGPCITRSKLQHAASRLNAVRTTDSANRMMKWTSSRPRAPPL